MIDENFFFLENGSIGEIRGFRKIAVSQEEQQKNLDVFTRTKLEMFNPPPGLSPLEYSEMFMNAFLKARKEASEQNIPCVPFSVVVQVGNLESLNELNEIERHPLFFHWEDDNFVKNFKEITKNLLNRIKF